MSVDKSMSDPSDVFAEALQHWLNLKHAEIAIKHELKRCRKNSDFCRLTELFKEAEQSAEAGRLFTQAVALNELLAARDLRIQNNQ